MALRLLAVGDLHLGRQPGSLPEDLRERDAARAHGPAEALRRLVQRAIEESVDAVLLAGDLVEDEQDFFEAYRDLHRAVSDLTHAGIRVIGVAGNHDVQVLPRLADELPDFHLLGRKGQWETLTLGGGDGTEVLLHGWSFPESEVRRSPLAGKTFATDHRLQLGLLHCDRDQSGSYHGPVTTAELNNAGLDAWLLGHIHKPDSLSPQSPSGYLGSVTALRRTESGARGPWLYTLSNTAIESVEQWLLAPLRWETLEVDLTGLQQADEIAGRLMQALQTRAARLVAEGARADAVGLRVDFTGRTGLREQCQRILENEQLDHIPAEGMRWFVGRWQFHTRPDLDLTALAKEKSPAGLLAERLRLLDEAPENAQRRALIERARDRLAEVAADSAWQPLGNPQPDDRQTEVWLRESLSMAIERLLAQREAVR